MANIPVNSSGAILSAGSSITGSFAGFVVLSNSTPTVANNIANITALKDGNGNLTSGSALFVYAGTKVEMFITSASLAAGSNPILLYY
jgi:hypothetical protein